MGILDKMKGKKAAAKSDKDEKATKKAPAKASSAAKASGDESTKVDAKAAETKKADKAEKVEAKAEVKRGPLAREDGGDSYRILVRPISTEKTSLLQMQNQYTFAVAGKATKVDVSRAVRDLYGVKPLKVRIVNLEGKFVRSGRSQGYEKNLKKAIVTLKQGDTISAS